MSDAVLSSLPLDQEDDDSKSTADSNERTRPPSDAPVKWQVVAETSGLLPAQIIADRLQSEGIPARAWQESVGQSFGMTVGPLGTGYVSVPEEFADEALALLEAEPPDFEDEEA